MEQYWSIAQACYAIINYPFSHHIFHSNSSCLFIIDTTNPELDTIIKRNETISVYSTD